MGPPVLPRLLARHLPRQRWYAGPPALGPDDVSVTEWRGLWNGDGRHLHLALVDAGGDRYQLLIGERPAGEPAEFLKGHEEAVVGDLEGSYLYDATRDPELARELLPIVTAGAETAQRVRPISAEQSNTSLVFDDRVIVKLFRRLCDGHNPDVEVTVALDRVGFGHVARPLGWWREGTQDLAFAQEFLAGGAEGWALALTSLRDYYEAPAEDPAEVGGDFAMEAARLGRVTAELHVSMAEAFGVGAVTSDEWSALVDDIERRLQRWSPGGPDGAAPPAAVAAGRRAATAAVSRLRATAPPGVSLRVHGDYHLGQVMRADGGWYVLDFEGEPARALEERLRLASPLKDVAGMLRSFDYAALFGLIERGGLVSDPGPKAAAWAEHNRRAFVAGYRREPAAAALLPAPGAWDTLLAAYELDKALYELGYEQAYRPAWIPIPQAAIGRIVRRLGG